MSFCRKISASYFLAVCFYFGTCLDSDFACRSLQNEGTCVVITKCQSIADLLLEKQLSTPTIDRLKKLHCGFDGHTPKICCSTNEVSKDATTTFSQASTETPHTLLPGPKVCGDSNEDRLIETQSAAIGMHAWDVLLEYQTGPFKEFHCGGALISKRYVLTAASCVSNKDIPKDWKLTSVRIGEYALSTRNDCTEFRYEKLCSEPTVDIPIENVIIHQEYKSVDENHVYDVALIRLAKEVEYTDWICPLCLPFPLNNISRDDLLRRVLITTGWGSSLSRTNTTDIKQRTSFDLKDPEECRSNENKILTLKKDQFCAKKKQHYNSCHAGRGTVAISLMLHNQGYLNYVSVGIVSSDLENCTEDQPYMIFTNLLNYTQWITDNIAP